MAEQLPAPEDLWAERYRLASERRRARGWRRNDEDPAHRRSRRESRRARVYVAAGLIFAALTILALVLPR